MIGLDIGHYWVKALEIKSSKAGSEVKALARRSCLRKSGRVAKIPRSYLNWLKIVWLRGVSQQRMSLSWFQGLRSL